MTRLQNWLAAASILAKVTRDRDMLALAEACPQYGFDKHKGYPTAAHRDALAQYGATEHHRTSFGPVRDVLEKCSKIKAELIAAD